MNRCGEQLTNPYSSQLDEYVFLFAKKGTNLKKTIFKTRGISNVSFLGKHRMR
ncbi:Uncharacterised protein [Lysinibacillus sphaericus]|nr:Uncharacterised protein [Lysinibacillus sphaericus]